MRILLTGATGLIGQAMATRLGAGNELITLGRSERARMYADLSAPESLDALDLPEVDVLVHCAGVIDEDFRSAPERAVRMALFGADALVRKAVMAGAQRLIYVSSAHVYGPMTGVIDEGSPINPVSDYAIAHFVTEQIFRRAASSGIACLALRPCAVFGALTSPESFKRWSLIPFAFPRSAVREGRIVIRSTGEQRRNFVGTDDIAAITYEWLVAPAAGWTVLNPLGAVSCSVYDFACICAEVAEARTGRPCAVERAAPQGPTPGDDYDYRTRSKWARGSQDLHATLDGLISAIREV